MTGFWLRVTYGLPLRMVVFLILIGVLQSAFGSPGQGGAIQAKLSMTIKDVSGQVHRPFLLSEGTKASILFFVAHDCPIANKYYREIQRIAEKYKKHKIKSCLVYVDPDMTLKDAARHMKDFGYGNQTAFLDQRHELVKATGAKVTPEAVVVINRGMIAYRGRIDNLYEDLGVSRKQITRRELREALDAITKERKVPTTRTTAVGCFIPALK